MGETADGAAVVMIAGVRVPAVQTLVPGTFLTTPQTIMTVLIPIPPVSMEGVSVRGAMVITGGAATVRLDTGRSIISTIPMAGLTFVLTPQASIISILLRELPPIPSLRVPQGL